MDLRVLLCCLHRHSSLTSKPVKGRNLNSATSTPRRGGGRGGRSVPAARNSPRFIVALSCLDEFCYQWEIPGFPKNLEPDLSRHRKDAIRVALWSHWGLRPVKRQPSTPRWAVCAEETQRGRAANRASNKRCRGLLATVSGASSTHSSSSKDASAQWGRKG